MSITFEVLGSLGIARLLSLSAALAGAPMPTAWSPDSRWIAYTAVEARAGVRAPSDWIFGPDDLDPQRPNEQRAPKPTGDSTSDRAGVFRIWATQAAPPMASALLEESEWPLGSPSWRPDGKAVAFARFVPGEAVGQVSRGRFEVIIKEGLDRRRVLHSEENVEVELAGMADFCATAPAWNRDGSYLAVARPTGTAAVLILDSRTGTLSRTVENAKRPAWSPNGSRLALVRPAPRQGSGHDTLILIDNPFSNSLSHVRILMTEDGIIRTPIWSSDGLSILSVFRKSRISHHGGRIPTREVALARVSATTGERLKEWPLGPEPSGRLAGLQPPRASAPSPAAGVTESAAMPGQRVDFHPETEECFYTTEQPGRLQSVVRCQNLRTEVVHKNFPPLDVSAGINDLAISPDGRTLAVRFVPEPGSSFPSAPGFCDIATEALTIPAADASIRLDWMSRLIRATEGLLARALPPPMVPGEGVAQRPVLLPAPGELTAGHPLAPRIRRLARIGGALCEHSPNSAGDAEQSEIRSSLPQAKLFFDYLAGDIKDAEASLNELDAASLTPRQRNSLLAIRAQVLMAKGDLPGARAIIDFLETQEPAKIRAVEETPMGYTLEDRPNPRKLWASYLSHCQGEIEKARKQQERVAQPDETGAVPPRPADMIDELNREQPARAPFLPFDPDARLFIEPPVFVRP